MGNFSSMVSSMVCDDRGQFAVGLWDGVVEIHEIRSGALVRRWEGDDDRDPVLGLDLCLDGGLVWGTRGGVLKKVSREKGVVEWSADLGCGGVFSVLDRGRAGVVAGCEDSLVRIVDGDSGREIRVCAGHGSLVASVASLGGASFASSAVDQTICEWANDGTLLHSFGFGRVAQSLSLSPCGQFIAVGCDDGSLRLLRRWVEVWAVEKAHRKAIPSVSWSPDGRHLVSGSIDGTAKIFCSHTGGARGTLKGHGSSIRKVLFTEDGTKVLTGSDDKSVRVWRIFWRTERRVRALCARLVVPTLTGTGCARS